MSRLAESLNVVMLRSAALFGAGDVEKFVGMNAWG
jgi:hypothetical protein